ncbi:SpaA isopeptide-forming pilin-related protein [Streptomyces sp. NPDC055815]
MTLIATRRRRAALVATFVTMGVTTALAAPLADVGVAATKPRVAEAPTSPGNVTPVFVNDNQPSCAKSMGSIPGMFEFKYEPVTDGTKQIVVPAGITGSGTVTIDVSNTVLGPVFAFQLNGDFAAIGVIAKGGPVANFYDYRPGGRTSDGNLHSPVNPNNPNGQYYGLSHVNFCLIKNKGALKILKKSTKEGNPLVRNAGARFHVTGPNGYDTIVTDDTTMAAPDEDPTIGEVCISGLAPGNYTVNEDAPPPGYGNAGQTNVVKTVVPGTNCTSNQPAYGATAVFTNPPLADLLVRVDDAGSGETNSKIICDGHSAGFSNPAILNVEGLPPGEYDCKIIVDP